MVTSYQLSQYKTWVRDRLGDQSFSDSLLTQYAEDTNRDICQTEDWLFLESTFTGTISSGIYYDLNATVPTLQRPIGIQVTDPDANALRVRYLPHQEFYRRYPDPTALTSAAPFLWSYFGGTLIIGPAPVNATYTLRLPYIKEPNTIVGPTDLFNVPDSFREVVVLGMLIRCLKHKRKYDRAQVEQQELDIQLAKMRTRLKNRQSSEPYQLGSGRIGDSPYADPEYAYSELGL